MELNRKHIAIVLVVLFLGSVAAAGVAIAQTSAGSSPASSVSTATPGGTVGGTASVNPAWTQYENAKAAGQVATQTPDGYSFGWVPSPIELSSPTTAPSLVQATIPTAYDLRTHGKVSPVEKQQPCGTCWTFATFGSLESTLLPGSATRYSENNLKNLHDFNTADCCVHNGGQAQMSTAYLARWGTTMKDRNGATIHGGPVTVTCDPYRGMSCAASACPIAKHVSNVYFLPTNSRSAIKSALMTYGGVYTAFEWVPTQSATQKGPYYNPSTYAYYDRAISGGNHAVTIVGWKDNFPASSFSTKPSGPGAWLVKNSWGTTFGKSGFFWVSYYDLNFGKLSNVVFTAQSATNYKTNYQYDPFGMDNQYGWGDTHGYAANVFTATSIGTLKAASFYAVKPGTQYTVQVYVKPTIAKKPTSGTLKSTISGKVTYAGYYTKSLSTLVPLTKGEKFAVVIKFTAPGTTWPVPIQWRFTNYDSKAPNAKVGQSFVSHDKVTWTDLAVQYPLSYSVVANIHAFAS